MQTNFKKYSDFFQRILQIIDFKNIKSVNDFAINWLGYDAPQKINRLKDPKNKPSYEIVVDIVNKFEEIDARWLITGKGEMLKNSEITVVDPPNPFRDKIITRLDQLIDKLEDDNNLLKEEIRELKKAQENPSGYGMVAESKSKLKK